MKSPARILQMLFVLEHLHFDCPLREAARMGGMRMLAWALEDQDLPLPKENETRSPVIH
jgi:hypothetical protein